jgi:peptide/nickel transport system permease protein
MIIPTLLMASFVIFFITRLIPGDIISALEAQSTGDARIDREMIEKALGLDAPPIVQYGRWLGVTPQVDGKLSGVLQGNLGESWEMRLTVVKLVSKKWPVTFELGMMALTVALLIALPVGIFSALRQDRWVDYVGRSLAILLISVPNFWVATMVIVFPSIWWGYMPPMMLIHFTEDPIGNLTMFIVPAVILGMAMSGLTMRMTRTMMLEVLRQDYIRTAWAKGQSEKVVVVRHALKNALIPVITIIGIQVPIMIGGTVITEQIFSLPGMGRLMVDAVFNRDEPLISGLVLIFAAALVLINLAIDLAYGFLDPRVHYK